MARLLLVEDDPEMAELVTVTLASQGHEIRHVTNAEAALREFEATQPGVVVLDVVLPDRSGVDVCAAIRERSRVPILFLTARGMLQDKIRGFRAGGDDYVVKPFLPTELVMRIDALLRRTAWSASPTEAKVIGDLEVDPVHRVVRRGGQMLHLSPMEIEILIALASSPGFPWSVDQLARRLGLAAESRAEAADLIYTKVSRLRRKLEPDPRHPRYLRNLRGVGYALAAPTDRFLTV